MTRSAPKILPILVTLLLPLPAVAQPAAAGDPSTGETAAVDEAVAEPAKEEPAAKSKEEPSTKITYQWFLSHTYGDVGDDTMNAFSVNRGYINIETKYDSWVSSRITPDVTVDKEGDGAGDLKLRLKYAYMKLHFPATSVFSKPELEFGLVHRPWLDFEEHVNHFRAQGTMFMERNHLFNSADYGVTVMSLLGGEMDDNYKKSVNSKYAGRYGSAALGLYNGGGYHALENNQNKVVEGRLTVRPLPDIVPGLQLSYFGAFGKGNQPDAPDWNLSAGFVSMESARYVLTGTYYLGSGNAGGSALDVAGEAAPQTGYSAFGELKIPEAKASVFGRYDYFDENTDVDDDETWRVIGGIAYHFHGKHQAILDYDRAEAADGSLVQSLVKFTVEVHY